MPKSSSSRKVRSKKLPNRASGRRYGVIKDDAKQFVPRAKVHQALTAQNIPNGDLKLILECIMYFALPNSAKAKELFDEGIQRQSQRERQRDRDREQR